MSGYRVYISAKEREVLLDLLANDINFSELDKHIQEKEKLISKLLDNQDQKSIRAK